VFRGAIRRAVSAAAAGAVIALIGAAPALAADPIKATPDVNQSFGSVSFSNHGNVSVGEMSLNFDDGSETLAYCIDIETPLVIDKDRTVEYEEGTWGESEVHDLRKVQWVLLHAYPTVKPGDLVKAAKADATGIDEDRLGELAYIATQVSVWRFSDGAKFTDAVTDQHHVFDTVEQNLLDAVYAYLTTSATDEQEPAATLSISPANATAVAGEKAGPFKITGPAGAIPLTAAGGTAVDKANKAITSAANGDEFYLTRTSAGDVTVSAKVDVKISTGRVFLYKGEFKNRANKAYGQPPAKSQKLILAGSQPGTPLEAKATAKFTPGHSPSPSPSATSPSPGTPTPTTSVSATPTPVPGTGGSLPKTGAPTLVAIGVGVALLAGGAVAVWLVRRRRVNFTA
jgi:TQXA domain-containing protein/LPXTG-motif cell wall-anchored protein